MKLVSGYLSLFAYLKYTAILIYKLGKELIMKIFKLWNLDMIRNNNSCLYYGLVENISSSIYDEQRLYDNRETKEKLGIHKSYWYDEHYSVEHLQFLLKEFKLLKLKLQKIIDCYELWDIHKYDYKYFDCFDLSTREYYREQSPSGLIPYSVEHIVLVQARAYEFFNECNLFSKEKTLSDLIVDDREVALCSSYLHLQYTDFKDWLLENDEYGNIMFNTMYGMNNDIFESSKDLRELIKEIEYILNNKVEIDDDFIHHQIFK